jgi:hypothetical protein
MATFAKKAFFTGAGPTETTGRGIEVESASIGSGTEIHVGSTTTTTYDEVWIYASNTSASAIELTIGFGGTTSPDDLILQSIPGKAGLVLVVPGLILRGQATALKVLAAAVGAPGEITLFGYVNRITA